MQIRFGGLIKLMEFQKSISIAANGADQALYERMRNRDVGNRLDLVDFKYAQVREPAVITKPRVVTGADVFRLGPIGNRVIEHPAHGYAVDVDAHTSRTCYRNSRPRFTNVISSAPTRSGHEGRRR